MLDDCASALHPSRRQYRQRLQELLKESQSGWTGADYGAGYLYQSFRQFGLRGFRKTEVRRDQMHIGEALSNKRVLEIGCNVGFLSLTLACETTAYVAFDNNPFLIDIASLTQKTMNSQSVTFQVADVEEFHSDQQFDVVLSFANHSTWDGNMRLTLPAYFSKIQGLLVPGGKLYFESHHPALENAVRVEQTLQVMQRYFTIRERRILKKGSAWDRGRTFVVATSLPTT